MFNTNADVRNGYYGIQSYDKKGNLQFTPLGKEITLDSIRKNIENGQVKLDLSFEYQCETRTTTIDRADITDPKLLGKLASLGADVTKKNFDTLIDTIRIQEFLLEQSGAAATLSYSHPGWITLPDKTGTSLTCFRANTLIGGPTAKYEGELKLTPMGTFDEWRDMVRDKVLGHPVLELALLTGLAAVVNGLIFEASTRENPILHLCSPSGTGKSTAGILAASVFGEAFNGKRTVRDADGGVHEFRSVYGTWGATPNATITKCAGNNGCVIVLNELGKFVGADMSPIIYNLSEGSDKDRLTKDLRCNQTEAFHTSILSLGEFPLLDRCKTRVEGLHVRVLQIDTPVTDTAEQADAIKDCCTANCGWAAPMMAQHLIDHGGLKYVLDLFNETKVSLLAEWPDTPSRERFAAKFPALFLTTAKIAEQALELDFDCEALKKFLIDLDVKDGAERSCSASSYAYIMEQVFINKTKFFTKGVSTTCSQDITNNVPRQETWGRINYRTYARNGRTVIQEIEVVKAVLEKMLAEGGFQSRKACINAWKTADVLDFEDERHATRSRKIDPGAPVGSRTEVYVFRVFATPEAEKELKSHQTERDRQLARRRKFRSEVLEGGEDDDHAVAS